MNEMSGAEAFVRMLQLFGVRSWKVEHSAELRPALRRAIEADPTRLDIVCQPLHETKAPINEWVS